MMAKSKEGKELWQQKGFCCNFRTLYSAALMLISIKNVEVILIGKNDMHEYSIYPCTAKVALKIKFDTNCAQLLPLAHVHKFQFHVHVFMKPTYTKYTHPAQFQWS